MNDNDAKKQLEALDLNHPIVKSYITLNKEMGVVQGELKWIKVLTAGTTIGVLSQLFITLFGG